MNKTNKIIHHLIFIIAALYVAIISFYTPNSIWLACLTLSFIFHWWIGAMVYLHLPAREHLNLMAAYLSYILIILCLSIGIIFFYNPVVLLTFFGLSFIIVIPLYHFMLKLDDKKNEHKEFIGIKYYLEYLGGIGFIIGAISIYYDLLPVALVVNTCTVTHLIILFYLYRTKAYHQIINKLELSLT